MNKCEIIVIALFILLFFMGSVMAENTNDIDLNQTDEGISDLNQDSSNLLKSTSEDSLIDESSQEILVEDWGELQYYSSLSDKNYVLKLKENTNYYPDPSDSSNQILFNNNVTIIGASGAYIGDESPNARNITYAAMKVPDNNGVGITVKDVLFKWIGTCYQPDGVFLQMCGNSISYFENCNFSNISTNLGHSSILHIKTGDVIIKNCSFINCTTDFGCISVYNPNDDPTGICFRARMNVSDSYFEGNYARTEPGCINNCGVLVVSNSTFYKNSAFWWAGAIHTHGGANTTIYDSDFIDNLAGWNGGALYTYSYLQIYNTRFIGNNCTTNNGGGAIGACKYLHSPYIHIEDSLFEDNENLCWSLDEQSTGGTGRGGAISLMDEGGLEVYNTTFIKNSASIGTAICAINGGLNYGSPNIRIVGNRFINHTRVGDVLDVRLATGSVAEIRDNYFENNSIVFSKLKLSADDPDSSGRVTLHIDAALKNPSSYDADILDKSSYDVYVDGAYATTVNGRTFALDLGKGNTAHIYVVPSISNSRSNEVFAGKVKTYVYAASNGDDNNNGLSRDQPVKTLRKAIEVANSTGIEDIVMMSGEFKNDKDLIIDFNLTLTAENNASISSVSGHVFKITNGDVQFENVIFKNCKQGSSSKDRIIEQTSSGFLILKGCVFENNNYNYYLIDAAGQVEAENLIFRDNTACLFFTQSIVIKSSSFTGNIANTNSKNEALFKYKTKTIKFVAENLTFTNNDVLKGCILVKGPATVKDCNFISNYMSATSSQKSSGINIESGSVLVESCKFINNVDKGNYASVIYTSGTLFVENSIFIGNSYENGKYIINGVSSALKAVTANNNWWGNTLENLTKPNLYVAPASTINSGWDPCKYWLVLNASTLSNEIELNKGIPIQFMFTQIDNDGNVTNYDGLNLPSFDLTLTPVNGTCSDTKLTVENGMALTYFTLTQMSTSSLLATFNGITTTINFQFKNSIPNMTISVNDILVGDVANIVVNLEPGATGNVILKIGDIIKNETILNSKATFSIPNLPAGNYTVEANYTGNDRFESSVKTANLTVNKHNSTTRLSVGNIEVDNDVVFTIILSNGATGTVDVYVNGNKETIDVGQTYTIHNIPRGDYVVRAIYNGDSYYLASEDEFTFEVGKLIPSITVKAPDITYGANTIVNVSLNNDATGSVVVTIDGKTNASQLNNGKASVSISNVNAGANKVISIYYSGDHNYKNATATKTYNVNKAILNFTIGSNNIKLGQDAIVTVQLPPRSGGTLTITGIKSETKNIPLTGLVTLTYSELTVGTYTVSAQYNGDNYQTISKSTKFEVSDWNSPQWPNQGYDVKNTEKSPYSSEVNGNVKWIKDMDGTIVGNMAIDAVGRVYITTSNGIYSINANDGSTVWSFNSQDAGNNFSGIAISRDTILATKSGDKLYFINQTTGEQYHNNIYQGSSIFAPIVDNEGNIYTSGEYYGYELTKLVVIPYKIWQTSTAPTSIEIGDYNITSSPVLADSNTVFLTATNRLIGINVSSQSIIFNRLMTIDSNPIIGYENVIYLISNGHIIGYNVQGIKMCDVQITGDAGNHISIGQNGEIFSINREGKLFEYSTGVETLIYDFKEPISSRLLVGQDEKLYVGSDSGMFYAIDTEGNLLWKENLNQSISGLPVMDLNGVIYTVSGNRIVALDNAQLKESKLTVDIRNVTYGEDVAVNIDLEKEATGKLSVRISNLYVNESMVNDGKASFIVPNLAGGTYTAEITYSGDNRFKSKTINVKFNVGKTDISMDVSVKNIRVGEVLQINITNLPSSAKGTISVSVGEKTNSTNVAGSGAVLYIHGLLKGEYEAKINYSGDTNYNGKTITKTVSVGYMQTSFKAISNNVNVGQNVEITITNLPSDANGVVYVTYNNVRYSDRVNNGSAKITIPGLANGTYDFDVEYANDTEYSADSQKVSVVVSKITPTFVASMNDINVGDDIVVSVSGLPGDATGFVIVDIGNLSKRGSVGNGAAKITIPQRLANGVYTVNVTYAGDSKYNKYSQNKTIQIDKIDPAFTVSISDIHVGDDLNVDISGLAIDAKGQITVEINGWVNVSNVENGIAHVIVHQRLSDGNYSVGITYSGDDKYNSLKQFKVVTISKITPEMVVVVKENINVGEDLVIDISVLPEDITVNYVDIVGDLVERGLIKQGKSKIVISNLTSGKYSFAVYMNGDDRYNMVNSDLITISVNKLSPEMKVIANNIGLGEDLIIRINLPSDISDEFVYVHILDEEIPIKVIGGNASCNISGLTKGTFNYTVTYNGNDKYDAKEYYNLVDVGKINIDYNITIKDISYGESLQVDITDLPKDASGNVTVIVNKKQYFSKVSGSSVLINVSNLGAGEYTAEVRYSDVEYSANSKYISFTVEKANPSIDVFAEDMRIGEELVIKVNLPKDAMGSVVVDVGEISKTVNLIEGTANINISGLGAGIQTISVNYSGNDNYNSISAFKSITVSKINPTIYVEADNIWYGDNLTVIVNLPMDATGNVSLKVDGKSQSVEIRRGNAIAIVSGLTAGNKSIYVAYDGDNKYNSIDFSKEVVVSKITPVITVLAENVKYGESVNVSIQISDNISGDVIISVENISKTVKAKNGIVSTLLSDLTAGTHTITARFNGDLIYNATTASKTIVVSKITPNIIVTANDIKYGQVLTIDVNLNSDSTGNVVIYVVEDGISKKIAVKDGVACLKISDLNAGNKTINVKYDGDDNYYSVSASNEIVVIKIDTPIIILADDIKYGENLTVRVNLNKEATGNVIISVEDMHQSIKLVDGSAATAISSLSSGVKTISVKYEGDANFNKISSSKTVNVTKSAPYIIAPMDVKIINESRVDINIPNATGKVSVIVDGKQTIISLDKNGKASLDLNNLTSGSHSVIVVYDGDDTYMPVHCISSLNVSGTQVMSSVFRDIVINNDLAVTMALKDEKGNVIANVPIKYGINGVSINTKTNGKGSVTISGKTGSVITVSYEGNEKFIGTDITLTLNNKVVPSVVKVDSQFNIPGGVITLKGYAVDTQAGEEGIYYATELFDINGKAISDVPIQFAVNDKIYYRTTLDNGSFNEYKLNMARAGRYTMAFFFSGNDDYGSAFASVCVDLSKKPITIKASSKTYKVLATKKYTVSLSTIVGSSHDGKVYLSPKKVSLMVGGKTYSGKTSKNGQVTFNLQITKKGKYSAMINFEGDNTYEAKSKSVVITVV